MFKRFGKDEDQARHVFSIDIGCRVIEIHVLSDGDIELKDADEYDEWSLHSHDRVSIAAAGLTVAAALGPEHDLYKEAIEFFGGTTLIDGKEELQRVRAMLVDLVHDMSRSQFKHRAQRVLDTLPEFGE